MALHTQGMSGPGTAARLVHCETDHLFARARGVIGAGDRPVHAVRDGELLGVQLHCGGEAGVQLDEGQLRGVHPAEFDQRLQRGGQAR